jgi:hypothetical protein
MVLERKIRKKFDGWLSGSSLIYKEKLGNIIEDFCERSPFRAMSTECIVTI